MIRELIYRDVVLSALSLMLILSSCVNENEPGEKSNFEEGIPTEVSFTLSARFNASDATRSDGTQPDGTPADPTDANEKINDWFLVFIDKDNVVRKIVTRTNAGITPVNNPVEEETFRFILPSGHYSVYAFANISAEDLKNAAGITFTEETTITPTEIDAKTWTAELNKWDISKPIPMTGFLKDIEVKNTIEETFSIEVVRMLAKVEFLFSNTGDKKVSINGISFEPVTSSEVSLFPRNSKGIGYAHLGMEAFEALTDASYTKISVDYTDPIQVGAQTQASSPVKKAIYIKESLSDRANGDAFTVGIKVSHENGVSERQQYNITKEIKGYINRNDWIVIPITLSQYDVWVEALFYPPIGGYPAVLSSTDPDGSQIFTFGTQGDFSIVPHVIDKFTDTHLAPAKYSIQLGEITGDLGIFTKTPEITTTATSLPDEITGILSSNTGTATIEVTVTIGSLSYVRKIYIIRE